MAGLVCVQQLSQAGYSVLVVDKSRGLGGRLATRRLHGTWADHGACYLKPKGELFGRFVEILRSRHWCGGNLVEGAMLSGLAAADEINNQLHHLPLDNVNFLNVFT